MHIRLKRAATLASLAVIGWAALPAPAQDLVNIDATLYGYAFPTDPAPVPGQTITPFSLAPGGAFNQLTLAAGTYTVTNAAGMPGADPNFTGYRFNNSGGRNWAWAFVIADSATNRVVSYGEAYPYDAQPGFVRDMQAQVANDPVVQNYQGQFTLAATTTLNFLIRDYFLPDNAGGVAIHIRPSGQVIPEPGTCALIVAGLLPLAGVRVLARRRRA